MKEAGKILDILMETREEGEWSSFSLNVTAGGTKEGPLIIAAILPGTTKTHAISIQNSCAKMFGELNK